jgi:acid phosphatase (class A)
MTPTRRSLLTANLLAAPLLAAFVAVWPAGVRAAEPEPYVTSTQLDLVPFLPPATLPGTETDRREQLFVITTQAQATKERVAQAEADADESVFTMFGLQLGPKFKAGELPRATEFFDRIGASEDAVVDPVKQHFSRIRPFMANPAEIKPLIRASRSGAYPSGHTTRVTMMAVVLTGMLPEKAATIWARAEDYAASRVVGGMHYPQDLDGGRRAGTAIAATMFADSEFLADYALAKVEVRRALGM